MIHLAKVPNYDGFNLDTLFHELGHVMNFRYMVDEGILSLSYRAQYGTGHGTVASPPEAYKEGQLVW